MIILFTKVSVFVKLVSVNIFVKKKIEKMKEGIRMYNKKKLVSVINMDCARWHRNNILLIFRCTYFFYVSKRTSNQRNIRFNNSANCAYYYTGAKYNNMSCYPLFDMYYDTNTCEEKKKDNLNAAIFFFLRKVLHFLVIFLLFSFFFLYQTKK
jgi:hypothetical protein